MRGMGIKLERAKKEPSATLFLWDFLLRLGDRVKTDERNGSQMREREDEQSVAQGVFVGSSIFDFAQDNRFSFSPC